jgi:hypothetical protein
MLNLTSSLKNLTLATGRADSKHKTLSFKQILQGDANRRRQEAWTSKFKLVRLLALGDLRFQPTPWVKETLNSGDTHFFVNLLRARSQEYSLEDPFIRIQLSQRTNNRRLIEKNKAYQLSPNELLFNLGVILLELGYDAPLQYLSSTEDIKGGDMDASWYTDFITARRLGKSAARELDARYGRLAKKCLDCDFGVGDDLNTLDMAVLDKI